MSRVLRPLAAIDVADGERAVFLAGSVERDAVEPWQSIVAMGLADLPGVVVLDPRRDDWDATWRESLADARFREQVEWELAAQERADVVAFHFAPSTRAAVALLEFGLAARAGRAVVCCPVGFWKRGNVEAVCARYGVPLCEDVAASVRLVRERLTR